MNPLDQVKALGSLDATKKAFSFWDEFKNFAFKGNVVDLAVGVIIGAAFGSIVKSLVDDVMMPLIAVVIPSDLGYADWILEVGNKKVPYGKFIGAIVTFLFTALVLWLFIAKFLGWIMQTKKEEGPPPPTKEQELLMEIRDLLKQERAAVPK